VPEWYPGPQVQNNKIAYVASVKCNILNPQKQLILKIALGVN
jgi:hypothetical protein